MSIGREETGRQERWEVQLKLSVFFGSHWLNLGQAISLSLHFVVEEEEELGITLSSSKNYV